LEVFSVVRRLAAILAVDVVGYSRLMGQDEAGTLAALKSIRNDLVDPKTAQYGGRVIKLMGDGALIEFLSAVDAVAFAVEVQSVLRDRMPGADGKQIEFRIGINIGDVIVDGDDLYGDGVNIAARLEGTASPGGICLSQNVYEQVKDKLDLTFENLGARKMKNIAEPVTVYRVAADEKAGMLVTPVVKTGGDRIGRWRWPAALLTLLLLVLAGGGTFLWYQRTSPNVVASNGSRNSLPDTRQSIAVLPFSNISGDKEQDYFADGMTEDLITDLSKIKSLLVVSRASTANYSGKEYDVREIGKSLNVHYVIEGSVRKAGDQIRINAQLVDTSTGGHVWAERYDGNLTDIFGLQDRVLAKIMGSLSLELSEKERQRLAARGTDSVAAHNLYLKGRYEESRFSRDGYEKAKRYYEQALAIDPNYPLPYTGIANILELSTRNGWSDDIRADLQKAVDLAEKAAKLDPQNPQVYWSLGRATARLRTPESLKEGIEALRKAIDLDPGFADAYAYLTVLYVGEGRAEDGLRSMNTAMQLNPSYPFWYLFLRGIAYFSIENYDAAIADFEAASNRSPTAMFLRWWLAASYAQVGRQDDADWQVMELESMGFNSDIPTIIETQPIQDPGYIAIYEKALRKAGIPE
jgi:adenylate cyclase